MSIEFMYNWCSGCRMIIGWVSNKFGIKVDENWIFGMKNRTFRQKPVTILHCEYSCSPRRAIMWQRAEFARHQFATANNTVTGSIVCSPRRVSPLATASNLVVLYLFMVYCCFIHFCFELAFGANMKVLGNVIIF